MSNIENMTRADGYVRFCLTAIVVLLAGAVLLLAAGQDALLPAATAAPAGEDQLFGNSSAWRDSMLKATEKTNSKLDELITLLKSGEVKVQVGSDKASGAGDASSKSK